MGGKNEGLPLLKNSLKIGENQLNIDEVYEGGKDLEEAYHNKSHTSKVQSKIYDTSDLTFKVRCPFQ